MTFMDSPALIWPRLAPHIVHAPAMHTKTLKLTQRNANSVFPHVVHVHTMHSQPVHA